MTSVQDHLRPEARAALELPQPERIAFCRADRWVGYTRAEQILRQVDDLLLYPRSLRMPCLLIVGRSNNGKSSIVEQVLRRHPYIVKDDGTPGFSISWIALPATPTESNFWSEVLWSRNISHRVQERPDAKRLAAIDAMRFANTRLLIIDEMNHLANAGKEAGKLLAGIKNATSALRIPIVATGTQTAIHAMRSEPQMMTRFEPIVLDRWTLNTEYLRFLASYEQLLPLAEPSQLASRELAPLIYGMAGDVIGGTVDVLKELAVFAIESGVERIDISLLTKFKKTRLPDWEDAARRA
ncbi:TniB family NTP-binding protein [Derxia gummosa]|uniref:TniB family NTP-binding protein n=1 Tax=Derxia gummosa DSM 723 TaxID=1121388 RepID=A0A8B6X4N1_9BURK|nr:TniB family NTP-binding protein [Derxia gummosa]